MDLDFFVLHSSLLSLIGSPGQANYTAANAFLDALAGYRRSLGLPTMVINWGPWDEAGMATVSGTRGEMLWKGRGLQYIPPADGIRVFDYLMHRQVEQVAVTITDWAVYLDHLPVVSPFYTALAQQIRPKTKQKHLRSAQEVQALLHQAPQQDHRPILIDFVCAQAMHELGFEERIDPTQPLNEVGLDSLMSVNLSNRLEAGLGVVVPVVTLIQGPSIEQLVDILFPDLASTTDRVTPQTPSPALETVTALESLRSQASVKTSGNGWLMIPKPRPSARVRLFCFPFAGAGAATFRSWGDALDPSIEVVAVEPPGRASRIQEPPLHTMEAFLEGLVPAMLSYLDKPCAFFGHCLGGLTLFEPARTLLNHHQIHLAHIFVSGARPPHRVQLEGAFEEYLLQNLLQHDKFDPFLPIYHQPDEVFAEVIRHFHIDATDEFLENPELRHLLLPTIRAEFAMTFRYHFTPEPPWAVPLTYFIGLNDPYVTREDALGWSQDTKVAFQIYMREGTHFTIVDDKAFILELINRELSNV